MLPEGAVPKEIREDVEGYEYQDGSLFTVHMAMHKVPTYKAAAFDPDINQAWVLNIGYECLEDYNEDWAAIRKGEAPMEPKLNVAINSMFDPTDAPEGKATGMIRVFAPYSVDGKGPGVWSTSFKDVYAQRCVDKLLEHCEGFAQEDIWVQRPYTPLDISEKLVNMVNGDWMVGRISESNLMLNRPSQALSQYRTPVKGLYLCGSTTHPHGFITFGPGYNALQAIAEDFGLDTWWVEI
jgi:phytoene dehydrogenase-like protein